MNCFLADISFLHSNVSGSESHSVVSDSLRPHGLYSAWNSPGQNNGVGSCSLLQEIFPTPGIEHSLPHCRWIVYQLSHQGSRSGARRRSQVYISYCSTDLQWDKSVGQEDVR